MFGAQINAAIFDHAIKQYPRESCGLIINDKYNPTRNMAKDPKSDFLISRATWKRLANKGEVQAVVHSHPDGPAEPSRSDMRGQVSTEVPWGIVVPTIPTAEDETKPRVIDGFWWGDFLLDEPLIGRSFRHGVRDCYSLVRSWWWQERKVLLPEYPRDMEWWDQGEDMYSKGFEAAGFRPLAIGEQPEKGDGFLAQIRSPVPNHAGVYLGDALILHHVMGQLSRRDSVYRYTNLISNRWLRRDG